MKYILLSAIGPVLVLSFLLWLGLDTVTMAAFVMLFALAYAPLIWLRYQANEPS